MPVHDQPVAAERPRHAPPRAARSTETKRCARRRSGGRGGADARARRRRRRAAAASGGGRDRRTAASAARPPRTSTPRHVGIGASVPLAQRQIGDLVALGGQTLCQVAVPALGATDRVREQAVIDEADAHRGAGGSHILRYDRDADSATFPPRTRYHRYWPGRQAPARMSTIEQENPPSLGPRSEAAPHALGRDPVPQRGRDDRGMRAPPPRRRSTVEPHRGRGDRRRQRLGRRQRPARRGRRRASSCSSPSAATAARTLRASRPRAAATSSWPTPT